MQVLTGDQAAYRSLCPAPTWSVWTATPCTHPPQVHAEQLGALRGEDASAPGTLHARVLAYLTAGRAVTLLTSPDLRRATLWIDDTGDPPGPLADLTAGPLTRPGLRAWQDAPKAGGPLGAHLPARLAWDARAAWNAAEHAAAHPGNPHAMCGLLDVLATQHAALVVAEAALLRVRPRVTRTWTRAWQADPGMNGLLARRLARQDAHLRARHHT